MSKTTRSLFAAAGLALTIAASSALPVRAEAVLRIAMTAGDIPDWTGQPDQGFEGYRFVGFNLYDGLLNWDVSKAGVEVRLNPDSRPHGPSIPMIINAGCCSCARG